jgi:4-hydroxy-2-oxoheptanedioate aldolase
VTTVTLGRVGAWCSIGNSYAVEVLASCGFDWICIDLQHGFASPGDLLPMLQAAAITGVPALVRVPRLDTGLIGRALDAGAAGVIIPMVNSAAQAREAVRACRYPPDGVRSWGPARLMLAEPDEIVRVPGVDAVFVGPSDLAVDMGLPPRRGAIPGEHATALAAIARICQDSGMPAGIFCGTFPAVTQYAELGYTILAAVTDAALIRAGAADGLGTLRTPSAESAPARAEPPGLNPADESETQ